MFFSFDQSNNSGAVDVKRGESLVEELSSYMLGFSLSFSPSLLLYCLYCKNWFQKKLNSRFLLKSFVLLRLLFEVSINLLYDHAWNTVVISGLVFLIATWISWISYRNRPVGLLVIHFILLLKSWLIIKISPAKAFTLVDDHLSWLNWFQFLILVGGPLVIIIDSLIFIFLFLDGIRMSMLTVSFLTQPYSGILCLKNTFLWSMIFVAEV